MCFVRTISTINGSNGFGDAISNRREVRRTQILMDGCQLPYILYRVESVTAGGIFRRSRQMRPVLSIFGW